MHRILIKDIEDLKRKRREIVDLQKKIDELCEVKILNEIRQQESELNTKINKLSTFDAILIGDIIAKLMSIFEGIPYQCVKDDSWYDDYIVKPKKRNYYFGDPYLRFVLKKHTPEKGNIVFFDMKHNFKINNFDIFFEKEKKSLVFLPPSTFISTYNLSKESEKINISYIQCFIDFLYDKRSNNSLYEITNEDLEIILQEFLLITKDLQQQRKEEILRKIEQNKIEEKRLEFEKSCVIDRNLIYNSLTYIINHYEENNIIAIQEYEKEWSRSSQWSKLYGYHNLIISDGGNKFRFKTEVDCDGCFPDEECCACVDMNKCTNICFFDLKNKLQPILKNSLFVEKFMNMIEDLYNEKKEISLDDIEKILIIISNDKKAKRRILKYIK